MVRATSLLSPGRAAGLAALLGGLIAWDALAPSLPDIPTDLDVALVAAVLIPAVFLTVWLLLPLADAPRLLPAALGLVILSVALDVVGFASAFNVVKLVALVLGGLWFFQLFETLWLVVVVAVVIPWADIVSVYRGPTKAIVEEQPGVFEHIAIAFSIPGQDAAARIGPPDIIFFALFLAATVRFGLRPGATWIGMTLGLAGTLVATYVFDLGGLPALPGIALGFLVPNADLLWRALRMQEAPAEQ